MNASQKGILWIGVLIVAVFLFTDQNFRNQIFKRGSANTTAPFTLSDILTVNVPASQSQTGGTGSVKLV